METVDFFKNSKVVENAEIEGKHLSNTQYKSPFDSQTHSLFHSDHVGNKQGTGLVHIAPALGQDDFKLALKHNLSTDCFINELGHYTNDRATLEKSGLVGRSALDKETYDRIKELLGGSLLHEHKHIHSYPYDWRTKKPCIIRSSMQWFIDTNKLKEGSIKALETVKIAPGNVKNGMLSPLSSRSYWCISRQRFWGLPIPCFFDADLDKEKKRPLLNKDFIEKLKDIIRKNKNADFWWSNQFDKELISTLNTKSKFKYIYFSYN